MSKAISQKEMALLKEASEMFDETGCVPGFDGEQVPAEKLVPDDLRPGDMGHAWVYAGSFVAVTKMATQMPQVRTSRDWEIRAIS